MAKVNFGTIANDARGKVNGTVYSKNKFGSYTRRKVTPANPNTPSQSGVRTNFGILSRDWSSTLTDAQRAAWVAYANTYPRLDVFGASIKLTGANMYISLNAVLLTITQPTSLTPPPSNVVTPVGIDANSLAAVSPGTLSFQQTTATTTDTRIYIFGQKPLPAGRAPVMSAFRFLFTTSNTVGPFPASVPVGAAYTSKFGSWAVGQKISLLVATVDRTSGLTTVGTILQAIST